MKIPVYCIKDDYLGFQTPFCSMNDAAANRDFELLLTKDVSVYSQHKNLFNLHRIAMFDTESGELTPDMEFIQNGSVFDRKEK